MISINEATTIIQKNLPTRQIENIPLSETLQRVLAADITAPEPSPRFTNSAMDGFAVRWQDVATTNPQQPVRLKIVGESRAGVSFHGTVSQRQAIRINTGAMLHPDTDTVIPVEDTEEQNGWVSIHEAKTQRQHVRYKGEEFETGDLVLRCDDLITPAHIGLLASFGMKSVPVYKQPQIAILITGTELVAADEKIQPGQIRDSNGIMLSATVQISGAKVIATERTGDNLEETKSNLKKLNKKADILLISGGVSVGPHDLVKQAAQETGFETLFWRVKQKPGKPLFVAKNQDTILFGLPGNPVSALNCTAYYVHPIIQYMLGQKFAWKKVPGILEKSIQNTGKRSLFLRVSRKDTNEGQAIFTPPEKQGSHILTTMAQADGFICLEPGAKIEENEQVEVILYPWRN